MWVTFALFQGAVGAVIWGEGSNRGERWAGLSPLLDGFGYFGQGGGGEVDGESFGKSDEGADPSEEKSVGHGGSLMRGRHVDDSGGGF